MIIRFDPHVFQSILAVGALTRGTEFSGLGWVTREGEVLRVYDFQLLDIGSETWTEIPAEKVLANLERSDAGNLRLWLHRHPMGDGVPGPHNWSGTDNHTIATTPLGGLPQLVGWSASVVWTLGGFVGRVDNHHSGQTLHVPVEPSIHEIYPLVEALRPQPKIVIPDEHANAPAYRLPLWPVSKYGYSRAEKELIERYTEVFGEDKELVELALEEGEIDLAEIRAELRDYDRQLEEDQYSIWDVLRQRLKW